jgi:hypothetical protein
MGGAESEGKAVAAGLLQLTASHAEPERGLRWACLPFRHTFATQRAADGWTLFRIAKEMGNSVAVVEESGFVMFLRARFTQRLAHNLPYAFEKLGSSSHQLFGVIGGRSSPSCWGLDTEQTEAKEGILAVLAPIQTTTKRKYSEDDEEHRENYYIGEALATQGLDDLVIAAESVLDLLTPATTANRPTTPSPASSPTSKSKPSPTPSPQWVGPAPLKATKRAAPPPSSKKSSWPSPNSPNSAAKSSWPPTRPGPGAPRE